MNKIFFSGNFYFLCNSEDLYVIVSCMKIEEIDLHTEAYTHVISWR